MERRDEHCRIAKQTILTTHPSGLQTRVSVELTNIECRMERTTKSPKKIWDSPVLPRRFLSSCNNTPVLSRRSDMVTEGRLSQQCTPVMKRRMEDGSPASSPPLGRREPCEMDNSIISGWLKYRDNKRWKSRWGVITKLSPAADCLHLQLYRSALDAARSSGGEGPRRAAWAALRLQHFLALESGFTLDREAHTLALVCQDHAIVLAFDTRERLIAWQVKVSSHLGASRSFLVVVPAAEGGPLGSGGLRAGPARLHVRRRLALLAGTPPALQAVWELQHLRRYGVVEGRFAWEAGARSGAPGAYCVACDRPRDIATAIDDALRDMNTAHSTRTERDKLRSSTLLSDINTMDPSDTASAVYDENFYQDDGLEAAYWSDRQGEDDSCGGHRPDSKPSWSTPQVILQRCRACLSQLGGSRPSKTLSPTTHFNPAWIMEGTAESGSDSSSNNTEYLTPRTIRKTLESCQCDRPSERPPKGHLEQKPPAPLPLSCNQQNNPRVGPYENYEIPKPTHIDQVTTSDYYDTPKRIKQALTEDIFQVTNHSMPGSLALKKNCGCKLNFGSKKKALLVKCEENVQPLDCPCFKVTNWANNLISLPYCKKKINTDKVTTEVLTCRKSEEIAIYATVDVLRKRNRQRGLVSEKNVQENIVDDKFINYHNMEPEKQKLEEPFANYENLEFAISLDYYENAKDLLKKAGVTQSELDALSANIEKTATTLPNKTKVCLQCGPSQKYKHTSESDEYLLMEPQKDMKIEQHPITVPNPGYTPMCPNLRWSQSLKYPLHKYDRADTIEKFHSIPTLNGSRDRTQDAPFIGQSKEAIQQRSSSVDSSKLLDDLKEFDISIGSHATFSSLETLRNMTVENRRSSTPGDTECEDCESSSSEKKISAACSSYETSTFRKKHVESSELQRCVSVPCKGSNRDSSSSNDSGVSSCSMKHATDLPEYELPLTTGHTQYLAIVHRRMRGNLATCHHSSLPRKSKSSDLLRDQSMQLFGYTQMPTKSSSSEADVPVLPPKQFKVPDGRSMSSGTSDMSDYVETLSLTSSHSSSDTAATNTRRVQAATSTLRPRSGKEYHVTHHCTHLP